MNELQLAEKELYELSKKVFELRKQSKPIEVKNYSFKTNEGDISLLELFGKKRLSF
jgi:predicted dithiol-disulfide oxidoreductase (DUF899 family)